MRRYVLTILFTVTVLIVGYHFVALFFGLPANLSFWATLILLPIWFLAGFIAISWDMIKKIVKKR